MRKKTAPAAAEAWIAASHSSFDLHIPCAAVAAQVIREQLAPACGQVGATMRGSEREGRVCALSGMSYHHLRAPTTPGGGLHANASGLSLTLRTSALRLYRLPGLLETFAQAADSLVGDQ